MEDTNPSGNQQDRNRITARSWVLNKWGDFVSTIHRSNIYVPTIYLLAITFNDIPLVFAEEESSKEKLGNQLEKVCHKFLQNWVWNERSSGFSRLSMHHCRKVRSQHKALFQSASGASCWMYAFNSKHPSGPSVFNGKHKPIYSSRYYNYHFLTRFVLRLTYNYVKTFKQSRNMQIHYTYIPILE